MNAINDIVNPLKPTLQSILRALPAPVDDFALSLLGPQCHASLLKRIDLSSDNAPCLKLAISKVLGTAIIGAAAVVKLPQLVKLLSSESAAGLSFTSYLLETAAFVINLAYSARSGFPFSTFGETAFIAIQDVAIGALILHFTGRSAGGAAFVAIVAAAAYALFAPQVVDMGSLKYLQAGAGVLGIASKVPQIYTIWQEGSTGQLSAFAIFNYLAGSLSRIFTTLQEVDDPLILYGFVAGFILNAVLAAQMVYYWDTPSARTQKKRIAAADTPKLISPLESPPAASTRSKTPSTRRRA